MKYSVIIFGKLRRTKPDILIGSAYSTHYVDDHTALDVRTVVFNGGVDKALDKAGELLQCDETVLNTLPYPLEES